MQKGDRVIVFDDKEWTGKDRGNNSRFFKPATIVNRYIYKSKYEKGGPIFLDDVCDVIFDDEPEIISKAHFTNYIKKFQ